MWPKFHKNNSIQHKIIAFFGIFIFIFNAIGLPAQNVSAQENFILPALGDKVGLSPRFDLPVLKGIKVYPNDPFRFDFILNKGDAQNSSNKLKEESAQLIKYFLASLTVPEKDMWVNLSPYEKNRIVPEAFGLTDMGRDILAQDYLLKQVTASVMSPEGQTGGKFWQKVYSTAAKRYGVKNIPVNTFSKVWIVPDRVVIYENAQAGTAYIVRSRLKVMLENDYLALMSMATSVNLKESDKRSVEMQEMVKMITREVVIPELEKEINDGKNFAKLRQVYQSFILAAWFKKKITGTILSKVYVDQKKIAGINTSDPEIFKAIWSQYVKAFERGAYSYIKKEYNSAAKTITLRKYFSGGVNLALKQGVMRITSDTHEVSGVSNENNMVVGSALDIAKPDIGRGSVMSSASKVERDGYDIWFDLA